jgi:hypothetical protein
VNRWLTEKRLRLYPAAVLFAVLAAFAVTLLTADGARSGAGILGGDHAAFHGAARLLADGRASELYDWSAQVAIQADLHPGHSEGAFLPFVYPPFVALPYVLLVPLGFAASYAVHTVAMMVLLFGSVLAMRPMLPRATSHPFALFVLLLAFYPMLRGLFGAQNTPVTLALLVLTWRALHEDREILAGAAAGLMLFKPQFGVPLLGLLLLRRRPRVLFGAGATAAALYLAGVALAGWAWPAAWWEQIARFQATDQAVNAANSVGILGFLEAVLGVGSPVAVWPGVALTATVAAFAIWVWATDRLDPVRRWGLTAIVLVVIPPHAMYYDAGLAGLALACLIERTGPAGARTVCFLWLAAALGLTNKLLGFNLLLPVLVAIAVALWRAPAGADADAGTGPPQGEPASSPR